MLKLLDNFSFKLLAFCITVFIWYVAKYNAVTEEMSFFVPLVFKNLPANMQITSDVPSLVNVSVQITRRRGKPFNPSEVQAVINLSNTSPGRVKTEIPKENFIAPEEVQILAVRPSQLELTIVEVIEKTLPIYPRYHGQLPQDYLLQNIQIDPATVVVRGPRSTLDELNSIYTSEINIDGITNSQNIPVSLELPDKNVEFKDEDVEFYTARIVITSLPMRKRFEEVPIYVHNKTHVYNYAPKLFNLFLEGPKRLLENMDSSQLYGIIDMNKYPPGTYDIQPEVVVPNDVTVLEQWPSIALNIEDNPLILGPDPLLNEAQPPNLVNELSPTEDKSVLESAPKSADNETDEGTETSDIAPQPSLEGAGGQANSQSPASQQGE